MARNGDIASSFRDPSGSLFARDGILYRRIARSYERHFEHAERSGMYRALMEEGLLIPHRAAPAGVLERAYKVIAPQIIPFISYPYEWCFSELQDAALLTLAVQKKALRYGMILKDASAFNVQFLNGRPIFIDTLSFESYEDGAPWVAYRQFCQHFLAPLALIARADARLNQLWRGFIDGIPLDLTSALLPKRTWLNPFLASHIHLHAKAQKRFSASTKTHRPVWRVRRRNLEALIESLEAAIRGLSFKKENTEWAAYYEKTNYTAASFAEKKSLVSLFLKETQPKSVWDLGGNTGVFSRLASAEKIPTISFDADPVAIEKNYCEVRRKNEGFLLPLILDLCNPSPGIGWNNEERMSLRARGPADTVMALALVHHLAIGSNIPLRMIAEHLKEMCASVIIEFIPKTDSQVQRLLATRIDVFAEYHEEAFEKECSRYFHIQQKRRIADSVRTLYLMRKK